MFSESALSQPENSLSIDPSSTDSGSIPSTIQSTSAASPTYSFPSSVITATTPTTTPSGVPPPTSSRNSSDLDPSTSITTSSSAPSSSRPVVPIPTSIPYTTPTRGLVSVPMSTSASESVTGPLPPVPSTSSSPRAPDSAAETPSPRPSPSVETTSRLNSTSNRPTSSSSSRSSQTRTSTITSVPSFRPSAPITTFTTLSQSVSSPAPIVDDVVTVIPGSAGLSSTSTVFRSPRSTLSEPLTLILTSEGSAITTAPPFVTVISTSTAQDGDVVILTEIVANPQPSDSLSAGSRGVLDSKGATAGIFVGVAVFSGIISFLFFMIWRRRRRTERRKKWFAGMRQQRPTSIDYPFHDGSGGGGGGRGKGSGNQNSFEGLRVERTVESDQDNQGGGILSWGRSGGRQSTPPQQHYRPHSTIAAGSHGFNYGNTPKDSLESLGLTGIGSAMYGNRVSNGTAILRGLPSPVRKPVSTHLYDAELNELDTVLKSQSSGGQGHQEHSRAPSEPPANAVRARFGLAPISEGERSGTIAATHDISVPPSSFHYHQRFAPSPAPSTPSMYPPTLPADDDNGYGGYDDYLDDDNSNLFYQRPAQISDSLPAPPRPPRSRLRESAGSTFTEGTKTTASSIGSVGSIGEIAPQSQEQGETFKRPKIGVNLATLFTKASMPNQDSTDKPNGKHFAPLTPPSSTASPLQEKHQDILANRRTLLDVRPKSLRSNASSN